MKPDSILLIEEYSENMYPFNVLHCSWEIRCGALRIIDKLKHHYPESKFLFTGREAHIRSFLARESLSEYQIERENILIWHSTILPNRALLRHIDDLLQKQKEENAIEKTLLFSVKGTAFAAYIPGCDMINPTNFDKEFLPKLLKDFSFAAEMIEVPEPRIINYLWDAIEYNAESIEDDFEYFQNFADFNELKKNNVNLINKDKIKIGENCKIASTVVLDASDGVIIIGNNVKIMPQSVIEGPCFIGDNSTVKIGAKIYGKTTIGEHCKIGGEIENSIIHAYSNKQHDGFLGHSYICEWVNIGADTNTSDLKNTYSNIKVTFPGRTINTGRMFLGLLCGDHTKTAIMTRFTTGTTVGIAGVLFSDDFLPRYIQSFCYGGKTESTRYKLEDALSTARLVMARRNKELTDEEEILIRAEWEKQ